MNSSSPDGARATAPSAAAPRVAPVDIGASAASNTGIPLVTTRDSGVRGPHLGIVTLTNCNEICGAHALDHLLRQGLVPRRGRLSLVFANVAAHATWTPTQPVAARYLDQDFNRVWSPASLGGAGTTRELARARELRPLIDRIDHLLDLHSMQAPKPPLALAGQTARGAALCRRLGAPANIVVDAGRADGVRLRDYGGFGDPASGKSAVLVECGRHDDWQSRAVAIESFYRFLRPFDAIDAETAAPFLIPAPAPRTVLVTEAVTMRSAAFCFLRELRGMELVPKAGTVIAHDGPLAIATPYNDCILVMPSWRQHPGQTALRFGRSVDGAP